MRARMRAPPKKSRMPRNFRENHRNSPSGEKPMNGSHLILLHKAFRRGLYPRTVIPPRERWKEDVRPRCDCVMLG
jgi:hypothetical protein